MEKIIPSLRADVVKLVEGMDPAHDVYHLDRVYNLGLYLQEREGGNKLVIGISAYLHEIHRLIQKEKMGYCSPRDSLPRVNRVLERFDLSNEIRENILHCVEFHEEYSFSSNGKTVDDIETLILQDADNLDAMGAIGIGRTFSYCGAHNVPMWIPGVDLDSDRPYDEKYKDNSTIGHFFNKLLRLKDTMNTQTAKEIALKKHKIMNSFVTQFLLEWKGEFK